MQQMHAVLLLLSAQLGLWAVSDQVRQTHGQRGLRCALPAVLGRNRGMTTFAYL